MRIASHTRGGWSKASLRSISTPSASFTTPRPCQISTRWLAADRSPRRKDTRTPIATSRTRRPRRRHRRHRRHRHHRRHRRPDCRLCGTSLSQEAVTAQRAARQHSPTPCRAPRPPERRTTKRPETACPGGFTGTQTAVPAVRQPNGSSAPTRPARPRPVTSMVTGIASLTPTSNLPPRPRLRKASPRGEHGAAPRGRPRM